MTTTPPNTPPKGDGVGTTGRSAVPVLIHCGARNILFAFFLPTGRGTPVIYFPWTTKI